MKFTTQQSLGLFLSWVVALLVCQERATSFLLNPTRVASPTTTTFNRISITAFASSSSSAGSNNNQRKPKKSVADRTQEEAVSLIQDIIQAAVDAGPQAGPARTFQAYRAFSETFREFLPRLGQPLRPFSAPKAIRTLFEKLGATYVKLGQVCACTVLECVVDDVLFCCVT